MREVQIGGLVPFTTIDYPGKLSAVLFLVGCPLRCAYCSNPHLLSVGDGEYDPERMFEWLQNRVGKLEAVVFSGGEALMQGDIAIEYMRRVRELGFKIVKVSPNQKKPQYDVYWFEDTTEFRSAIPKAVEMAKR